MKMGMFRLVTLQILLVVISGVLTYPSMETRRSYTAQTKALRVGYCQFDELEHARCYMCARLYTSLQIYTGCCNRKSEALVDLCRRLV